MIAEAYILISYSWVTLTVAMRLSTKRAAAWIRNVFPYMCRRKDSGLRGQTSLIIRRLLAAYCAAERGADTGAGWVCFCQACCRSLL